MKRFEILFDIVKIPIDFAMTLLAFFAAYQLRIITQPIEGFAKPIDYSVLPTLHEYLTFSTGVAIALVAIFAIANMYSLRTTSKLTTEIKKTITLCIIWATVLVTYFFFTRTFPFSRLAIIYSWVLTCTFIILGRTFLRIVQSVFLNTGIGKRKLLFIGNNDITKEIFKKLEKDARYTILGMIGRKSKSNSKIKYLGSISQLSYLIKKHEIDEILQTRADITEEQNKKLLHLCDLNHISYRFVPDLIEMRRTNIEIDTISGIPVLQLKHTALDGWGKVIKRILDIMGALTALILLSPIMLITAIAIKIDSKGPILFTKLDDGSPVMRVGQYGRLFKFYKFRSMKAKTDSLRYTVLANNNTRNEGPLVKIENDPRTTRVGKFIRKYSIDELAQLWNVLIGNLSLVGPRPHLPEEVAKYEEHQKFVLTIKPGVTGISQTSGRSNLSFDEEVKLDHFYIENWTIWTDIKIILKTFKVVLQGHDE